MKQMTAPLKSAATVHALPARPDPDMIRALDAIRSEGFSAADLARARAAARDRRLRFTSDYDAIRALRASGAIVRPTPAKRDRLPDLLPHGGEEPDLAAQSRKKGIRALGRLAAFVAAPTVAAAVYFSTIATPLYVTHSEFVIQGAENIGTPNGPAAGMSGPALPGNQDAISVQGYLTSRAAFAQMDEAEGFADHFSGPGIDLFRRISEDATSEDIYRSFLRHVKVSFDPSEGILRMQVSAADPEISRSISLTLLSLAEGHLDHMTAKLRDDHVDTAANARARADQAVAETQQKLIGLQQDFSVLSGDLEMDLLHQQIGAIEADLAEARLARAQLLSNRRPNTTKIDLANQKIRLLEESLAAQRARITDASENGVSIARAQAELAVLQAELEARQKIQTESVLALERARSDAGRQVRYLALGVEPVLPGAPEYPRPLIHTLMAFAAFLGIYLFASLSFTLIREQILK